MKYTSILALTSTLILSGCGGGGADSPATPPPPPPQGITPTSVTVTTDPVTNCVTEHNADAEVGYFVGSLPVKNLQWHCGSTVNGTGHIERLLQLDPAIPSCYVPVPEPTTPATTEPVMSPCVESIPIVEAPNYGVEIIETTAQGYTYPEGVGIGLQSTIANIGTVRAFNLRVLYVLSAEGYVHETSLAREIKWIPVGETVTTVLLNFSTSSLLGKNVIVSTVLLDLSDQIVSQQVTTVYVPPLVSQ